MVIVRGMYGIEPLWGLQRSSGTGVSLVVRVDVDMGPSMLGSRKYRLILGIDMVCVTWSVE
jgi:hypothetical protein